MKSEAQQKGALTIAERDFQSAARRLANADPLKSPGRYAAMVKDLERTRAALELVRRA